MQLSRSDMSGNLDRPCVESMLAACAAFSMVHGVSPTRETIIRLWREAERRRTGIEPQAGAGYVYLRVCWDRGWIEATDPDCVCDVTPRGLLMAYGPRSLAKARNVSEKAQLRALTGEMSEEEAEIWKEVA